jgi:hypothetical protein
LGDTDSGADAEGNDDDEEGEEDDECGGEGACEAEACGGEADERFKEVGEGECQEDGHGDEGEFLSKQDEGDDEEDDADIAEGLDLPEVEAAPVDGCDWFGGFGDGCDRADDVIEPGAGRGWVEWGGGSGWERSGVQGHLVEKGWDMPRLMKLRRFRNRPAWGRVGRG